MRTRETVEVKETPHVIAAYNQEDTQALANGKVKGWAPAAIGRSAGCPARVSRERKVNRSGRQVGNQLLAMVDLLDKIGARTITERMDETSDER